MGDATQPRSADRESLVDDVLRGIDAAGALLREMPALLRAELQLNRQAAQRSMLTGVLAQALGIVACTAVAATLTYSVAVTFGGGWLLALSFTTLLLLVITASLGLRARNYARLLGTSDRAHLRPPILDQSIRRAWREAQARRQLIAAHSTRLSDSARRHITGPGVLAAVALPASVLAARRGQPPEPCEDGVASLELELGDETTQDIVEQLVAALEAAEVTDGSGKSWEQRATELASSIASTVIARYIAASLVNTGDADAGDAASAADADLTP